MIYNGTCVQQGLKLPLSWVFFSKIVAIVFNINLPLPKRFPLAHFYIYSHKNEFESLPHSSLSFLQPLPSPLTLLSLSLSLSLSLPPTLSPPLVYIHVYLLGYITLQVTFLLPFCLPIIPPISLQFPLFLRLQMRLDSLFMLRDPRCLSNNPNTPSS